VPSLATEVLSQASKSRSLIYSPKAPDSQNAAKLATTGVHRAANKYVFSRRLNVCSDTLQLAVLQCC